ncbi:MAG: hypothetical protein WC441_04740 [Patescibacteria group bacterium]
MGFAKNYNNKRRIDTIGGKTCNFRSKGEWRLAQYFQLLKDACEIKDWEYETHKFVFPDSTWLVDFVIRNNDDTFEYWEFKGLFEADTRLKLKLLNKYEPQVKITMVFYSKNDAKKIKQSLKYLDKVCVLTTNGINTIYNKATAGTFGRLGL